MRMRMLRLFLFLCQHHKSMKILSGRARICGISPITSPPVHVLMPVPASFDIAACVHTFLFWKNLFSQYLDDSSHFGYSMVPRRSALRMRRRRSFMSACV